VGDVGEHDGTETTEAIVHWAKHPKRLLKDLYPGQFCLFFGSYSVRRPMTTTHGRLDQNASIFIGGLERSNFFLKS
jgi:hypothetical protein